MITAHPRPGRLRRVLLASAGALALLLAAPAAADSEPGWRPAASETLVKLPSTVLQQTIERDFQGSALGQAVDDANAQIGFKNQTLGDLQQAIGLAEGAQQTALKHQFLAEKRDFIQIAVGKNRLRKSELETKRELLEDVLAKLGQDEAVLGDSRKALVEQQKAARERFQASIAKIDAAFEANPLAPESAYARDYQDKVAAIEQLRHAIASHPMNQEPVIDGETVTKADYVRHLIASAEGELALVAMEEEMLGYMAKLVSLDALALAEQVEDPELADSDLAEPGDLAAAVNFFIAE